MNIQHGRSSEKNKINPQALKTDSVKLALDRTVLANERTYQAWVRTGVSTFAAGLGIEKFLKGDIPPWVLLAIATILLSFSTVSFLQAAWRYSHLHLRMEDLDLDMTPRWLIKAYSLALAGCTILTLISLFVTVDH
ncbi:MAG: hypothetical protein DSY90_03280 [Deltaproteobacteria bacterium]|nr:MAG: hypothetical protein DSY90_03280 [Deltaproteobacteria bacterium]